MINSFCSFLSSEKSLCKFCTGPVIEARYRRVCIPSHKFFTGTLDGLLADCLRTGQSFNMVCRRKTTSKMPRTFRYLKMFYKFVYLIELASIALSLSLFCWLLIGIFTNAFANRFGERTVISARPPDWPTLGRHVNLVTTLWCALFST